MPQYYLDANIFIQAKNNSYPLEMFPGFWDWIDQNANDNIISSSSFVYHEIINGEDDLAEWMKGKHPANHLLPNVGGSNRFTGKR